MFRKLMVPAIILILILTLTGCPGATGEPISGNIEIKLTGVPLTYNLQTMNGKPVFAKVYDKGSDPLSATPISSNGWYIVDGTAHFLLQKTADSYFDAGDELDLYLFIDMDSSSNTSDVNPVENSGDVALDVPVAVTIDGNQIIKITFSQLKDVP